MRGEADTRSKASSTHLKIATDFMHNRYHDKNKSHDFGTESNEGKTKVNKKKGVIDPKDTLIC